MLSHQHFHKHNHEMRAKMLPAEKILLRFGLRAGQSLADLGCGPGYFTLPAAEIVGGQGIVKAVDINAERLEIVEQTVRERGLAERVETYLAHEERVPLPDQNVDITLVANVLHELNDPLSYLQDTKRILKDSGEIWVIEWQNKETPMGPPLSERRSLEEWILTLEQAGFNNIWVQIFQPAHILLRGFITKNSD